MPTEAVPGMRQQAASRTELARGLLARVDWLAARLGDIALAAEIQLLKRELARGHGVLSAHPEDNNFLSVITLVEAALASLTWKEYTPSILDALRRAFSIGLYEGAIPFEEYDAIRQHFKTAGIPTGPTLDPNASEGEDEDGSQA